MIGFLRALLVLAGSVTNYLQQRQLIEAGHAKGIAKSLQKANRAIDEINAARLRFRSDPGYRERVRATYREVPGDK